MLVGESKFECKVSGQNTPFEVLAYDYDAGLSTPYLCKVEFISPNPDLDFKSFINKNATLSVSVQGATSTNHVSGIVTEFTQMGQINDKYTYSIKIEPSIVQLKNQEKTDVFLGLNIPDIAKQVFKTAGIQHVKFELSQTYPTRDFVCQFQETDYNFVFRWLEYEGIYYYFEHSSSYETLVLTDKNTSHKSHQNFSSLQYTQGKNLLDNGINNVDAFSAHNNNVAKLLVLKGYDYSNNTQTISGEAQISSFGNGNIEIFDENVLTESEATAIAKVRAQEISGMEQVFSGKTHNPGIAPGFMFGLQGHFRNSFNQKYLVFEISQTGSQKETILAKYGHFYNDGKQHENEPVVTTYFKAIPNKVQFRPSLKTPSKKVSGVIPALIDAETSGTSPQLDDKGRYKIRLLYSDKAPGQASDWIRKMESYIGENYGSHYPVLKDGEACIGFQFGNPDRPIIMGMLQNSTNQNPVTSENNEDIVLLATPTGNKITASDVPGKENVTIYSPYAESTTITGYSGAKTWDAANWIWPVPIPANCGSWSTTTKSSASQTFADSYSYTQGSSYSVVHGVTSCTAKMVAESISLTLGGASQSFTVVGDNLSATVAGANQSLTTTGINTSLTVTGLDVNYTIAGKTIDFKGDDVINTVAGNLTETVTGASVWTSTGIKITSATEYNVNSTISSNVASAQNSMRCGTAQILMTPVAIIIRVGSSMIEVSEEDILLTAGGSTFSIGATGAVVQGLPVVDINGNQFLP